MTREGQNVSAVQCEKGLTCLCWLWRWGKKSPSQPLGAGKGKKLESLHQSLHRGTVTGSTLTETATLVTGHTVTIRVRCFTTERPGKERGTNKPPPIRRVQEWSKGDTTCPTTSQNPPCWHPSWLSNACATRKDWVRMIGQRQPGNKSHHHKTRGCEPRGRAVLLGSLTLLLSTRAPLPNKVSCFVSTCVSSDNSFLSVRQEVPLPATEPALLTSWLQLSETHVTLPTSKTIIKPVLFTTKFVVACYR